MEICQLNVGLPWPLYRHGPQGTHTCLTEFDISRFNGNTWTSGWWSGVVTWKNDFHSFHLTRWSVEHFRFVFLLLKTEKVCIRMEVFFCRDSALQQQAKVWTHFLTLLNGKVCPNFKLVQYLTGVGASASVNGPGLSRKKLQLPSRL